MTLANVKERFFEELRDGYSSEEINLAFKALSDSYHQQKISISENDLLRDQHLEYFDSALQRLRKNEPLEYILGEARFFGRGFKVNSEVHVPRPESETMIEWVLEDLEKLTKSGTNILDIGSGSGVLAITLAKEIPGISVTAMDISKGALAVARENADRLEADIDFLNSDLFKLEELPEQFNLIVSNPPYILRHAQKDVQRKYLGHEPPVALYIEDEDPMVFNRKIAHLAKTGLKRNGAVFVEINQYLKSESEKVLQDLGFKTECRNDIFGNPRTLKASLGT